MLKKLLTGVAALSAMVAVPAYAALPTSVQGSFTTLQTDFESVFGYAFAVLTVVVISMLAWKYTRKLGSKV